MPALIGESARSAIVAAQRAELKLALSGSGLVRAQTPEAGAVVAVGSTVSVVLQPPVLAPAPPPAGKRAVQTPADKTTAEAPATPDADPAHATDEGEAPSPPLLAVKQAGGRDG